MSATATVSVWAPRAQRVEVVTASARGPMTASAGGWFTADPATLPADWREGYGFSLDGGPARPDPRSPWQPDGPHGLSRPVDWDAVPWTDHAWRGVHLPAAVVYELHVGTFSPAGTFAGVIEHLDHLVDLGVDVIELMPVAEFEGRHGWGYDGVDLWAPHHAYGGPGGLARLVDACHARGIGVLLDVVYNHLGPSGNYLGEFGPYFTDTYRTPWGPAVNYDDADSDEVRAFVVANACHWLEHYHLDGLRLDAIHAIFDRSAVHVLEELARAVDALGAHVGRPLWLVAESDLTDPRVIMPAEAGGFGVDAQWADDVHHAIHAALTGERDGYYADFGPVPTLASGLGRGFVFKGQHSPHRRRRHGREPVGLPGWRFVAATQNHDQVGNRALGERLVHLTDERRARVAAGLLLLAPFVPMLFQGEEWGASAPFQYFTDFADPELGAAVRAGRRQEFAAFELPAEVPDPQDPATFARSRLDWDELGEAPHAGLLDWYRRLIALRRAHSELGAGWLDPVWSVSHDEHRFLVVRRPPFTIAANLRDTEQWVPWVEPGEIVLASAEGMEPVDERLLMPAWSLAVVRSPSPA